MLGKYKYYFRKPKSEITKDILLLLLVSGALVLAGGAVVPYRFLPLLKSRYPQFQKYPPRKVSSIFAKLKKKGYIMVVSRNRQIYITLTKEGRKKAGIFQIDSLRIRRPKKWDKKWRILIFDISNLKKSYREALRGKLKELGFYKLQKSVWIHPFDCAAEVALLKDFFGFTDSEMKFLVAEHIGNDTEPRKFFKL